jgi:hypothetical protein
MFERRRFTKSGERNAFQAVCDVRRALTLAALAATACSPAAVDAPAPQSIVLERQVVRFAPTRADMTVGIVRLAVFIPDGDWTVRLPDAERTNFQEAGTTKYLELQQTGKNQFELPSLTLEPQQETPGPVCVSVKTWFNEVSNVNDSLYYLDAGDRNALLSFCTLRDERVGPRYSQNHVPTLLEFRAGLAKPIALNLRHDIVPWRPGLLVDGDGAVYFHSLLIGRHTPGTLAHHLLEAWKLSPDGLLMPLPVPNLVDRPTWPERMRSLASNPFTVLMGIASTEPVARDAAGNLYTRFAWCQRDGPPPLTRLARIDANGGCHELAGSSPGHRDGKGRQAQFHDISALAIAPDGHLYVADGNPSAGSWIRRVAPDGTVTTLAGADMVGFADGPRQEARFHLPSGIAVDGAGNVYAADPVNSRIRRIAPDGVVTTVPVPGDGKGIQTLEQPSGVAVGANGDLYILDGGSQLARVRRVSSGKQEFLVVIDGKSRNLTAPR